MSTTFLRLLRGNSRRLIQHQDTLNSWIVSMQSSRNTNGKIIVRTKCKGLFSQNQIFATPKSIQFRSFFAWLNHIFNRVDAGRIKDVGPDRACAEWLLRCGASVKWKGMEKQLSDYNSLPVGNYRTLMIETVDATDSAIMETGFPHFRDLEHFHKLKLRNCRYITDESIGHLVFITKDQLDWLELSDNGSVTDAGVAHLRKLYKLKYLKLGNLQGVDSPEGVFNKLKSALPNCEIIYNDLSSSTSNNN